MKVRAVILDETLEVSQRARTVLGEAGVELAFAGSEHELPVALAGPPAGFLIVNLTEEISSWQVVQQVRRGGFHGRILVLADHLAHPGTAYFLDLPHTKCMVRPPSIALLDNALASFVAEASPERARVVPAASPTSFHGIVGRSRQMQEIFARIDKVAAGDANVCIYGESGTGKELIARAIHYSSSRRDRPLITLDCTTIPEGLMESHLFGHVKGAFTGAVDQREGVFSLAHTGTLFIDELCELGMPLQAKLLRVIQTREFSKVGGSKPIRSNIRLITATNKDPKRAVEAGTFREDLYYRVAVVMIKVPALRERREDIPLLVEHFLAKFSVAYHKRIRGVTGSAMERLMAHPWPGNVRQLENFLEQAVVMLDGDTLTERDLFLEEQAGAGALSLSPLPSLFEPGLPLRDVERHHILRTLDRVQGNRTEAAKLLGISIRCLQYKLKAYLQGDDVEEPFVETPREPQLSSKLSSEMWT